MPRALRPCPTPGCPTLTPGGRCAPCKTKAEQRRGTAHERGYNNPGHASFRRQVLARDPICVTCYKHKSKHADHYPTSRRDLVAQGLDPNNPEYGRGLCHRCHSTHTAHTQPGGWHTPTT